MKKSCKGRSLNENPWARERREDLQKQLDFTTKQETPPLAKLALQAATVSTFKSPSPAAHPWVSYEWSILRGMEPAAFLKLPDNQRV